MTIHKISARQFAGQITSSPTLGINFIRGQSISIRSAKDFGADWSRGVTRGSGPRCCRLWGVGCGYHVFDPTQHRYLDRLCINAIIGYDDFETMIVYWKNKVAWVWRLIIKRRFNMSISIEIPDDIMETVKLPPDRAKRELTWQGYPPHALLIMCNFTHFVHGTGSKVPSHGCNYEQTWGSLRTGKTWHHSRGWRCELNYRHRLGGQEDAYSTHFVHCS